MEQKYTIHDIAKHAGVGTTTVSRVLNNHPYVSETTRRKVEIAIEEFGYRPSFSARHMRNQNTLFIGFITDEAATTPWAIDMIRGAHEAAISHGKMLLILSTGRSLDKAEASIEFLLERQIEGLIYAAMFHRVVDLPENIYEVPTVLANCYDSERRLTSSSAR